MLLDLKLKERGIGKGKEKARKWQGKETINVQGIHTRFS
jgi:hypothetical protein